MKRKVIFIIFVLLIVSVFLGIKLNGGSKTIEEAIHLSHLKGGYIIHEEKTDKGSLVFYSQSRTDNLLSAFVTKGLGGYKMVYNSGEADAKLAAKKFGLTNVYFPKIEKTSLPEYCGVIGNPEVSKVKVVEKKRNIEEEAKIINTSGMRLWLVDMNKLQGSDFDIIGLSEDGKELVKIDGDIYPHSAEEKAVKGYQ